MVQEPPLRDAEALRGRGWGEQLVGSCLCVMVQPLSLDHGAEEGSVDISGEMADLTAKIRNDGQRHATEDGRVFVYVGQRRHGRCERVRFAYHHPEGAA